ncbi:MAG: cadmium-translocating P-type ATPase [Oscillospiraceae bacterium]|jgi:Cd2+/Zn2+-exporting ATPase|nr:cadmium-translocating P-type ATPase [Oscillospiraceae bacterium]
MEHSCKCQHSHSHSHEHSHSKGILSNRKLTLALSIILFVTGILLNNSVNIFFFLTAYLLLGLDVLLNAVKGIVKGHIFDENFLMSIATIGAFCIGEYAEGVAVMLFYRIGMLLEEFAETSSEKSISELMDIRAEYATFPNGEQVNPENVKIGDLIIVKPGEKIPLDGIVTDGKSSLNTAALTGESLPVEVEKGAKVLSGSVNIKGLLTIKVTNTFENSTVTKIIEMVKNASEHKTKSENFITKFAKVYTPIVVFSALILAILPPILTGDNFAEWIERALVFLVVSCPCALVISIPLSYFGGIGGASRQGILVKGSNYLDALTRVSTVLFDKTGTLTTGKFTITSNPLSEYDYSLAASLEKYSNHPIAKAYTDHFNGEYFPISDFEETAGNGIKGIADGHNVEVNRQGVYVDNEFKGYITIEDTLKLDSKNTVSALKKYNITPIMLTGDKKAVAEKIAKNLNIEYFSELLPQDKVKYIEKYLNLKTTTVFIGDGINDAPVLARADIGIAMGGVGSDAAIEAADIVFMNDEPSKILTAIKIAKKTKRIAMQNIIFALSIKLIILILGALGIANMWLAVFGDVGVTLIVILSTIYFSTRFSNSHLSKFSFSLF